MQPRPLTPAQLSAWLALCSVRGLPPALLRELLGAYGDAQTLIAQPFCALAERAGTHAAHAVAAAAREDVAARLERTRAWCAAPGHALVALDDPAYPPALLTMHDPPPLLYVRGALQWLHARGLAIVGSRNATAQGADDAGRFARELAASGLVIVSGLALGIDAAAHRGALAAGGCTVAVVGTGADLVYPAQHGALARAIIERGAIVSEWPLGTPAKPAHFPQRNRLIAGLSHGVLVVEAAQRSGSLITARLANEMGREVFAIPGSIHAPLSRGCHQLIKEGAKLTESAQDVLDELCPALGRPSIAPQARRPRSEATEPAACGSAASRGQEGPRDDNSPEPYDHSPQRAKRRRAPSRPRHVPTALPLFDGLPAAAHHRPDETDQFDQSGRIHPSNPPSQSMPLELSPAAAKVLEALGHAPTALEMLAVRTEMSSAALQGALLELELRGHLTVLPGGRYVRHVRRAPERAPNPPC
ncbi:MAG: DNA-protecting protein DprA [Paraburkholderia sp.]|nr:MAG: DNA-protecting protein DprA [Paraburkholderia sp.]